MFSAGSVDMYAEGTVIECGGMEAKNHVANTIETIAVYFIL